MTKEEIKALVSAKIAGQGNQVDLGTALAEIINALADGMGGTTPIFNFSPYFSLEDEDFVYATITDKEEQKAFLGGESIEDFLSQLPVSAFGKLAVNTEGEFMEANFPVQYVSGQYLGGTLLGLAYKAHLSSKYARIEIAKDGEGNYSINIEPSDF